MLCFLRAKGGFTMLCYQNLECIEFTMPERPGESPALTLLFTGIRPVELRIEGRNLMPLADALRRQAIAWIRECPPGREPTADTETVVTGMTLLSVEL